MEAIYKIFNISRIYKQLIVLTNDIILSLLSLFLSFSLLYQKPYFPFFDYTLIILIGIFSFIPFFIPFGLYKAIFRYSGIYSLVNTFASISFYGLIYFLIIIFANTGELNISLGILHPIIFFIFIAFSRITVVLVVSAITNRNKTINSIIYGAGKTGIAASIGLNDYNILSYIDDDINKQNKKINGIKVLSFKDTFKFIDVKLVTNIFVCISKLSEEKRRDLILSFDKYNVSIKFLPNIDDLVKGNFEIDKLHSFQPSDFINRKIQVTHSEILKELKDKIVLITGAGGSIGSELSLQISEYNPSKIILLENNEYNLYNVENLLIKGLEVNKNNYEIIPILLSITEFNDLDECINQYNPDLVFHVAAYKHVPLIEKNIFSAIYCNIFGSINIINACEKNNVKKLVFISTDKAVRPTNIMGATKRFAEIYIQSYNKIKNSKMIISIVRFGNVFGSRGSVVPLFNEQIKNGGPLTVTHPDVTRYFMSIPEAVSLVLEVTYLDNFGGIYLLNMGKPMKVLDLAKKMIKLSGYTEKNEFNLNGDIEIVFTGLRPGEKLFEELMINGKMEVTINKDIFAVEEDFVEWSDLTKVIDNLNMSIANNRIDDSVKILGSITNLNYK